MPTAGGSDDFGLQRNRGTVGGSGTLIAAVVAAVSAGSVRGAARAVAVKVAAARVAAMAAAVKVAAARVAAMAAVAMASGSGIREAKGS